MVDKIADTLIRIKNGYRASKPEVSVYYSKLILNTLAVLKNAGYISDFKKKDSQILVTLKYNGKVPALTEVKRISKPSLRVYKGVKDLPVVLGGVGIAIVSTPKGVMTGREAKNKNLGGEIMAEVW